MNYSTAARKAISAFNQLRGRVPTGRTGLTIERTAEFRTLKVLESTGSSKTGLTHVLFELEFCSENGDKYRSVWIRVSPKEAILDIGTLLEA